MSSPHIVDINLTRTSPPASPKLSVVGNSDKGIIRLNNLPPLETSGIEKKSVNFGPGADLLINQKVAAKSNSPKSDIKLSELQTLHYDPSGSPKTKSLSGIARSKLVASINTGSPSGGIKLNISPTTSPPSGSPPSGGSPPNKNIKLGEASKADKKGETWDGFKKFNEIPVNPVAEPPPKPKLSHEEEVRQKFSFIRKLEALEKQGITVSKKYNMDDKLAEMQGEYEMIKSDIAKRNSVKFQGKMLMAAVSGIEFLNGKFDPFDIKLDGWGEAVSENIDEYDEVFGELHEKYGGKAKMAPELKLLFMLGGSAAMLHMTNTMFKSAMPGMDDIMRQNPDLMQQFTQAAAQSMNAQNPNFGNFMSGMMPQGPPPPVRAGFMPPMGSPPGPPQQSQPRTANRPDINMARGIPPAKSGRREMQGPSDISNILSGIKTKKVNIRNTQEGDTISINELKEIPQWEYQKNQKENLVLQEIRLTLIFKSHFIYNIKWKKQRRVLSLVI